MSATGAGNTFSQETLNDIRGLFTTELLGQFASHSFEAGDDRGKLDGQRTASRIFIGHW